jgi:hypothetical protein
VDDSGDQGETAEQRVIVSFASPAETIRFGQSGSNVILMGRHSPVFTSQVDGVILSDGIDDLNSTRRAFRQLLIKM